MGNLEWANPVLRPEEDGRIAGEVRLEIDDTKPWSKLPYFPVGGPVMPETPTQGVRDAVMSTGAIGHGWSIDGVWRVIRAVLLEEQALDQPPSGAGSGPIAD